MRIQDLPLLKIGIDFRNWLSVEQVHEPPHRPRGNVPAVHPAVQGKHERALVERRAMANLQGIVDAFDHIRIIRCAASRLV